MIPKTASYLPIECSHCQKGIPTREELNISFPSEDYLCNDCKEIYQLALHRSEKDRVKEVHSKGKCMLCKKIAPDVISIPCCHMCICHICVQKIPQNFQCPMCYEVINSFKIALEEKTPNKYDTLILKCSNCHKNLNFIDDVYSLTFTSKLLCNDCYEKEKDQKNSIQPIFVEEKCAICLEHVSDTIVFPCGHLCVCHECAMNINDNQCPICHTQIKLLKYVFDEIDE